MSKIISYKLDKGNLQTIMQLRQQQNNHIAQVNKEVDNQVSLVCGAFLNAKGIVGQFNLSPDGTMLIQAKPKAVEDAAPKLKVAPPAKDIKEI